MYDKLFSKSNGSLKKSFDMGRLLGRDPVCFDLSLIQNMVGGRRILITGGGGSIGSELCNQVLSLNPASVVIVDRCENYIHELHVSLGQRGEKVNFICASVSDSPAMAAVFSRHKPHLVFHAAAHKHVPLMENNVSEAAINNFIGTKIVADFSDLYGVEKFVLLSTDKVVSPSSVMGMTKKVAERYIRWLDGRKSTRFVAVRFGNILGSRGSVVPLFWNQILNGGPVTVTDPRMERYFIFLEEAAQLVLQSAAISSKHGIFLLEMGRPLKILDLAKRMIRLAGYEPYRDLDIEFIGMRPGEKLVEELIGEGEILISTEHDKINCIQSNDFFCLDWKEWSLRLETLLIKRNEPEIKKWLVSLARDDMLEANPSFTS